MTNQILKATYFVKNEHMHFEMKNSDMKLLNVRMESFRKQSFMHDPLLVPIFKLQVFEITCRLFDKINVVTVFEYLGAIVNQFYEIYEHYLYDNKLMIIEQMDKKYLNKCIERNTSVEDISSRFDE
ncbi:hypothetical protein RF11_05847 [Thelohanellus kitauei]|uniref:Uncharacterized protein n=1 Tax=Thelohanellus kitauei TaxID=669202 RepID=A0A0C2IW95_THEKT|nr:hypothetical protein RF11_05847 [Thelohanellus kitauei]